VKVMATCECGSEYFARRCDIASGHTSSCGCVQRKRARDGNLTHGASGTAIYSVWSSMLGRCRNSNRADFRRYGARGIAVCERWATFENFLADMGPRPAGMSLDRIDGNGNYEPENCRWATIAEQNRNRRGVKLCRVSVCLIRYMARRGARPIDVAHAFGISNTHAAQVASGLQWRGEGPWMVDS
jgi:hypothetical protein